MHTKRTATMMPDVPPPDTEAPHNSSTKDAHAQVSPLGRKRDPTRDAAILDAALDVLAEIGYERMTMDMVATRAAAGKATIYRRWPSKEALILDAVARMKRTQVDLDQLPDTGALRSDLLALFKPQSLEASEHKLKVMTGLAALLLNHAGLAEAAHEAMVAPWTDAHRIFMQRAVARGEIAPSADIETAAQIIPSMAAYRALIQRKPFEHAFLVTLIDSVLLPALRHG
jgi:AcrR family transcriptional regulator